MIKSLALVILSSVLLFNTGCCYEMMYYPAGSATYLWLPGMGEWKIHERMPSASIKESLFREDREATSEGSFGD